MNDAPKGLPLHRTILDSIWARLQWDFLMQNPQLSDWLEGSELRATDDPDVFHIIVAASSTVDWLSVHAFVIRRYLSVEMKRPVRVRVVAAAAEGVTK